MSWLILHIRKDMTPSEQQQDYIGGKNLPVKYYKATL